ncbi:YcgL domain-containing protein [Thiohalobacter sp. IOR34]|uniref:YcgL domain-containing protein n=1 Tax=Thiohalobacter sp. IOR34 TaxID=3057176 RepID=UPI0025AEFDF6|nr:YcgL domain-containing protein [Thiohalobacter sp. IOR34]WJW76637.1 YcgL domain-containing protein [Thiohalobacter sp. IOR34]
MPCAIYKGPRKADTYLYVEQEGDFERVPAALLELLGPLQLVMTLDLDERQQLALADIEEVRRQLREQGYYLQMPPEEGLPV